MSATSRYLRTMRLLIPVAVLAFVAACGGGGASSHGTADASFVTIAPAAQQQGVRPDAKVRVHVRQGEIQSVTVMDAFGARLSGSLDTGRKTWVSTEPLLVDTVYGVTVDAVDAKARRASVASVFWTLQPAHRIAAKVAPLSGETVGVGQPIAVYFTAPVQHRAAVEALFHVAAPGAPAGRWHWYSDTEMHYRPPTYWPAGTHVALSYDLRGVDAGDDTWGDQHRTIRFTIGPSHISKVDARTHTMQVYDDGQLVQTFPVSTGRDKYPTSSGIHVVLNKNPNQLMDSATIGIPRNSPAGYYEHVPWSVRISNSGEFVHDAPWSVRQQGHVNVSHGCVNLSPTASKWFFDFSRRGDIVHVIGTPRTLEQGNGYADWNLSWADWISGDAIG